MRHKLLILLLLPLLAWAQPGLQVIGGRSTTTSTTSIIVPYDSLYNIYNTQATYKLRPFIGQRFTYYNICDYAHLEPWVPRPWRGSVARSDISRSFYRDLARQSGKEWTLTDVVEGDASVWLVLTDDQGKSMIYNPLTAAAELLCHGYCEKAKVLIGKTMVRHAKDYYDSYMHADGPLPRHSMWTVQSLVVDTTYWGTHSQQNDLKNGVIIRLAMALHNPELGDLVYPVGNLGDYITAVDDCYQAINAFIDFEQIKGKDYDWGKTGVWPDSAARVDAALKGNPDAIYQVLEQYFSDQYDRDCNSPSYRTSDRRIYPHPLNIPGWALIEQLLAAAIDGGYITRDTRRYVDRICHQYIPYPGYDTDPNNVNDYDGAAPWLRRAEALSTDRTSHKIKQPTIPLLFE
ncbi:MAG: hypothetical protein IJ160_13650 [Muribaculaceae bacterium]|nr:hypothetical protein [Muribaculaceae bacterium]